MCRNGAEATTTETTPVHIDRKTDHLVSWWRATLLVFGVRQTRIRKVEGGVNFLLLHGRIRRIDHQQVLRYFLREAAGLYFIRLLLDVFKVGSKRTLIAQAFFVRAQFQRFPIFVLRRLRFTLLQEGRLRNGIEAIERHATLHQADNLAQGLLSHTVDQQISTTHAQDVGEQFVFPVVVMRYPTQGGFDAANQHGHIRVKLFELLGVNHRGVIGAEASVPTCRISIG